MIIALIQQSASPVPSANLERGLAAAREAARQGARVIAFAELAFEPQAGTVGEWPAGLYEAELQVAAFQNGYFTALCNRVGPEERLTFAGGSFVCAPDGRVLARARAAGDEILLCDVDLSEAARSHARRLFLRDRRPELYGGWLGRR